jgi:phage-related protein
MTEDSMVLLHAFVKKARIEPDQIALARKRQKQVEKEERV